MSGIMINNVNYQGEVGDLLLSTGTLTRMDQVTEEIDAKGLIAVPAFEDLHVHFREPGFTDKEDLRSGARAAIAGGYATVYCEPNTKPVIDSWETLADQDTRIADLLLPIDIISKCALTLGQQGQTLVDFAAILEPGIEIEEPFVIFSSDGEPVTNQKLLVSALRQLRGEFPIHLHCEETPRSRAAIEKVFGPGEPFTREVELIQLALSALAEAPEGIIHIQHVSLAESALLIAKARERGLLVTAEVTPHHLLLCEEDIPFRNGEPDANWKMNPPLRSRADMLTMRRALAEGVIDCIATDHAPHTPAEKAKRWDDAPFGVIGLETAFGACMSLVHAGELPFARLIEAMSEPIVTDNAVTSLTLIDPRAEWTVDPDKFYSKSRNCPFAGMTFKGKPVYTIANGQVVMAEGEVLF